jgi:methylated-DNA-[protein]-cysteine S-methyltransferase
VLYKGIMETTPVGPLEIFSEDDYIIRLDFGKPEKKAEADKFFSAHLGKDYRISPGLSGELARCMIQLSEYFAGVRKTFDLQVKLYGTPFYQRVWTELTRIPYGQVISYGELARRAGSPKGFRAVGQANHNNPISIIIPCHRVVGADNRLTGYGGGLDIKETLLRL